jgi:hypothetical protein
MEATVAEILSARVRIRCTCKGDFDVDLGDGRDYAKCPACGDVCWMSLEAGECWTDPRERPPDADMIAVGMVVEEQA